MYKDINQNSASLRGTDYLVLLGGLSILVGVCIVGYVVRWIEFCNLSDDPYRDAIINTVLICATAIVCSFICANDSEPKYSYRGVLLVGAFLVILPTTMFFRDYLIANLLFCIAFYQIMSFSNREHVKANIFFSTFITLAAYIFIPQSVFLLAVIYISIFIFAVEDIRHFFIPILALGAAVVSYTTYNALATGELVLLPEVSAKAFILPYTDKVFSSYNFYFYLMGLGLVFFYGLWGYFRYSFSQTMKYQKRFIFILIVFVAVLSIVIGFGKYKYLSIFFMPIFVTVTNNIFYLTSNRTVKETLTWYLGILAVLSLFLFK